MERLTLRQANQDQAGGTQKGIPLQRLMIIIRTARMKSARGDQQRGNEFLIQMNELSSDPVQHVFFRIGVARKRVGRSLYGWQIV